MQEVKAQTHREVWSLANSKVFKIW